jgi:hypothetical protein
LCKIWLRFFSVYNHEGLEVKKAIIDYKFEQLLLQNVWHDTEYLLNAYREANATDIEQPRKL